MQCEFDVIVVGGGGSGLAAAVRSAERGCRVLLLEKEPHLGGTTGIAVGSFTANRTPQQQQAGIEDAFEDHAEDAGRFATAEIESRNNDPLRSHFLSETARTMDWLLEMGLAFYGPSPEPPNRVPRMHNVVPNAKAYIATLQARLLRLGGTIQTGVCVDALIRERERVVGVEATTDANACEFRATRGVVLAGGDYANSPEIIARHKGPDFSAIEGINPNADGRGHRLAESVGARMVNMDVTYGPELRFVPPPGKVFEQLLPSGGLGVRILGRLLPLVPKFLIAARIKRLLVTWQHPEDALFDDGAILVNNRGERFCNEREWPAREIAVANQPGKVCYLVLDRRLIERYSEWPRFISTAPEIAYAYVEDYLRLRPDVAVSAKTLDALASQRGLPAKSLHASVARFNQHVAEESADAWGRSKDEHPLQGDRWVLLGPTKAWFTTTEGGAAINERLEVLDESGASIPGLFAVGQNGLGGQILWSHGLHIAWALTSGRLAGEVLGEA